MTVDVTYLQNYLQPGMDTRFSLANVLTNTYNTPLWAKATLNVYYHMPKPSRKLLAESLKPSAASPSTVSDSTISMVNEGSSTRASDSSSDSPTQAADVPSEVLPLTLPEATDFSSLVSVSGDPSR